MSDVVEQKPFWRARVRVLHGPRRVCEFMANAGLGITGIGFPDVHILDYKPGVEMTPEQVLENYRKLSEALDAENHTSKIVSYKLLSLTFGYHSKED